MRFVGDQNLNTAAFRGLKATNLRGEVASKSNLQMPDLRLMD
jgi:hypothetical protein